MNFYISSAILLGHGLILLTADYFLGYVLNSQKIFLNYFTGFLLWIAILLVKYFVFNSLYLQWKKSIKFPHPVEKLKTFHSIKIWLKIFTFALAYLAKKEIMDITGFFKMARLFYYLINLNWKIWSAMIYIRYGGLEW